MKPLAYGYVRRDAAVHDDHIRQMEDNLRDFAEREGYCLDKIFHEEPIGDRRAFSELIEELKCSEVRHVMTPSPEHLSAHPLLHKSMLLQLAEEAGAHVLTVRASVGGTVHHVHASHPSTEKPPRHF
jgi:hypothetical protein